MDTYSYSVLAKLRAVSDGNFRHHVLTTCHNVSERHQQVSVSRSATVCHTNHAAEPLGAAYRVSMIASSWLGTDPKLTASEMPPAAEHCADRTVFR